jgi:hypothetical protein
MEKTIPPFPFTVAREKRKEEIKLQPSNLAWKDTNPNDSIY